MMFKKPPNLKYTDMCIYIDNTAYSDNKDDNLIYEYLYHLIKMLAHRHNFFAQNHYYEEFAIYGAGRVFTRLNSKNQYELNENGAPKVARIKSILNYLKSTIYPMKVDFEKENYTQVIVDTDNDACSDESYLYIRQLCDESSLNSVEFMDYLHRITQIVREELSKIPYTSDQVTWTNIYISCMLTFINSITLSNKNKTKLYIKDNIIYSSDAFIDKLFREENKDPVLLFHLDPTMKDYILVLTNKIKKKVSTDLSDMIRAWEPTEEVMKNLLFTLIKDSQGDDSNEY